MTAPILVLSNVIIDDLSLADGTHLPNTLGGAATYAATAARLWWDDVAVVAGVGDDFDAVTAGRSRPTGCAGRGICPRPAHHPVPARLPPGRQPYRDARLWRRSLRAPPGRARGHPGALRPAAGTYIFRDLDAAFWESLRRVRADLGIVLWELHADAITGRWADVAALMPLVDLFSLNLQEARAVFGDLSPGRVCDAVLEAGAAAVVLRMGGEGALVATPDCRVRVIPPPSPVIDVTGGGNAFCGGFLAGWLLRPGEPEFASRRAAASAAHALGQFGPADPLNRSLASTWADKTGIETAGILSSSEGFHEPVR